MRKVYVICHGPTNIDESERYLGSINQSLNQEGRRYATDVANHIASLEVAALITSPLLRATQTAEIISHKLKLAPLESAHFRERNLGVLEGLTHSQARKRFPGLDIKKMLSAYHQSPPGGESIAQIRHRIKKGIKSITQQWPDNILLVTHKSIVREINWIYHNNSVSFALKVID